MIDEKWNEISNQFINSKDTTLIAFHHGDNLKVGWGGNDNEKMMKINLDNDEDEGGLVGKFVTNHLEKCLQEGNKSLHSSITETDIMKPDVNIHTLFDKDDNNLLMIAAKDGNVNVLERLIKKGLNINQKNKNKLMAIDLIDKTKPGYAKMFNLLIKHNSKFPENFEPKSFEGEENVYESISDTFERMKNLHELIKAKKYDDIRENLNEVQSDSKNSKEKENLPLIPKKYPENIQEGFYKYMFVYYDPMTNKSAFSQLYKTREGRKIIADFGLLPGPNENLRKIFKTKKCSHENCCLCSSFMCETIFGSWCMENCIDKHYKKSMICWSIMKKIMFFGVVKDKPKVVANIKETYENLLELDLIEPMFKTIYYSDDYVIAYNIYRDVQTHRTEYQNNYAEKAIIIDCKLDELNDKKELATITSRKICNFTMYKLFTNHGLPYVYDKNEETKFQRIVDECKQHKDKDILIKNVFERFDQKDELHSEMIACYPALVVKHDISDKQKFAEKFKPLESLSDRFNINVKMELQNYENSHKKFQEKYSSLIRMSIFILLIVLVIGGTYTGILIHKLLTKQFKDLTSDEVEKIYNLKAKYHETSVRFGDIMKDNPDCLNNLRSNEINSALGLEYGSESASLTGALSSSLRDCFHLTWNDIENFNLKRRFEKVEVDFQGFNVEIGRLASRNLFKGLASNEIKEIFNGKLKIGEKYQDEPKFYINRFFTERNKTPRKEILNELQKTKVFIIADEIGAGKSTTLKKLVVDLKPKLKEHWVAYIDLKNHLEILKNIENSDNLPFDILSTEILNLNGFDLKIFKELFEEGKIILVWENFEEIAKEFFEDSKKYENYFLDFVKEIKNLNVFQVFAVNYENSRKFEGKLNEISHKFEKFDGENVKSLSFNILRDEKSSDEITKKISESFVNFGSQNEEIESNWDEISFNNPSMLTYMIKSNKVTNNVSEILQNFVNGEFRIYIAKQKSLKIKEIYQKFAIKYFFGSEVKIWKTFSFDLEPSTLMNFPLTQEIKDEISNFEIIDIESEQFYHRTLAEFFIVQHFYESFCSENNLKEFEIEEKLNMLKFFSNFYSSNFVRNFVKNLKNEKLNSQTLKVLSEKFEQFLKNFNSNENPEIFANFFEDKVLVNFTKFDWLYENFNILPKNLNEPLINDDIWQNYEENHQKGIIFFQLWTYRTSPSIFSILSFTKIPINEDFLLEILAKEKFIDFYDFIHSTLSKKEQIKLNFSFLPQILTLFKSNKELSKYLHKNQKIFENNQFKEIFNDLFNKTEIFDENCSKCLKSFNTFAKTVQSKN